MNQRSLQPEMLRKDKELRPLGDWCFHSGVLTGDAPQSRVENHMKPAKRSWGRSRPAWPGVPAKNQQNRVPVLPTGFAVESGLCPYLLRQRSSLTPWDILGIRLGSISESKAAGGLIKEATLSALPIPTLQMALTGSCDPHPHGKASLPGTWTYSKKL